MTAVCGDVVLIQNIWLVVLTPLKNISELGWFFPIYGNPTSIMVWYVHVCAPSRVVHENVTGKDIGDDKYSVARISAATVSQRKILPRLPSIVIHSLATAEQHLPCQYHVPSESISSRQPAQEKASVKMGHMRAAHIACKDLQGSMLILAAVASNCVSCASSFSLLRVVLQQRIASVPVHTWLHGTCYKYIDYIQIQ
jgi:hypothetical protein